MATHARGGQLRPWWGIAAAVALGGCVETTPLLPPTPAATGGHAGAGTGGHASGTGGKAVSGTGGKPVSGTGGGGGSKPPPSPDGGAVDGGAVDAGTGDVGPGPDGGLLPGR